MFILASGSSGDWQTRAIDAAGDLLKYLTALAPGNKLWGWLLAAFIILVVLGILLYLVAGAFAHALEAAAKALEAYKQSGLPVVVDRERLLTIRKRKQFCDVLIADLAYIAKAENWNDQFFADLEAEVEIEGGYYSSTLMRLLKRRSFGLRRVSSLIKALDTSLERSILITGEPGSGKSVALRHLARQLAERGTRSGDPQARIPLYINLRELTRPPNLDMINADFIRDFVLDNIRRGDSDTSAYVRDHWDEHRDSGLWFFLFDSFDEIPDVLHSATGDGLIRIYAEAIRAFLDGMSGCRGLLASREFKGPTALPWHKFRILPLTSDRQNDLIRNSYLAPDEMALARQHVASSDTSLGSNPLFLSLLCRYIRGEHRIPTADHELLAMHIDRLAEREHDYIRRKYSLATEDLLRGAEQIAAIFAEDPALGLAPTMDQIEAATASLSDRSPDLETLLAALVDVKIGRSDVPNARSGDRRFAFSHRRYQETLFVRYLRRNPLVLTPDQLVGESRWRDYTVTLLQTSPVGEVSRILEACALRLRKRAAAQEPVTLEHDLRSVVSRELHYYDWRNDEAVRILELAQEGLARRLDDVTSDFSIAVSEYLTPRWDSGDELDRLHVISLGGLLPQHLLAQYLSWGFKEGSNALKAAAFQQSVFLRSRADEIWTEVQAALRAELLKVHRRADLWRLEALAGRLPEFLDARRIVRQYKVLASLVRPFAFADRAFFAPSAMLQRNLSRITIGHDITEGKPPPGIRIFSSLYFLFLLLMIVLVVASAPRLSRIAFPLAATISLYGIAILAAFCRLLTIQKRVLLFVTLCVAASVVAGAFWVRARLGARALEAFVFWISAGSISLGVASFILLVAGMVLLRASRQKARRLFRRLKAEHVPETAIALSATSPSALAMWIRDDQDFLNGRQYRTLRSLFAVCALCTEGSDALKAPSPPLLRRIATTRTTDGLRTALARRLEPTFL